VSNLPLLLVKRAHLVAMKRWILALASIVLTGLFVAIVLVPWRTSRHPDHYVSREIVSPLPTTLRHVKTIRLFKASMGDGDCMAAYSIASDDFSRLLQARAWTNGFSIGNFEAERHFRAVWPDASAQFEAYHLPVKGWRHVDMAVSTDHTRVIFLIGI
jgi:hypothetical protein